MPYYDTGNYCWAPTRKVLKRRAIEARKRGSKADRAAAARVQAGR